MRLPILAFALLIAGPAAAQTLSVQPAPYQSAPWWMREPIIASLGEVRAEVPANRARLSVSFESVAQTAADATRQSAEKVRVLNQSLVAYGAERVRVETSFSTRPLYAQYKDKTGTIQDNQREDKIDRYAVTARVNAEVRDLKVVERVYATLIAAKPSSVQPASFSLVPDNATNAAMAKAAVSDAATRARAAAADTGARLGAIKLIDPTARACSTDVLIVGAPRSYGGGNANDVSEVVAVSAFTQSIPPPPPPPAPPPPPMAEGRNEGAELEAAAASLRINLQPPLRELTRQACVIYALAPQS